MADVGRPTVVTQEVLLKLEEAFLMGCSDQEACFFADIHPSTLYKYQQEHPEFTERKEELKLNPFFLARKTILRAIAASPDTAKWYLERRDKAFKPKSDITTDDKPIPIYGGKSTELPGHNSDTQSIRATKEN